MAADQSIECGARQKRHNEEGLLLPGLLADAEIVKIDNVRMSQFSEDCTLFAEQLDLLITEELFNRFQRDVTLDLEVNGTVNDPHAALADDLLDLVSAAKFGCR